MIGRIVRVIVSSEIRQRIAAHDHLQGNQSVVGSRLPMLVTREWSPSTVNGTLFVDGEFSLWMTSVVRGTEPGQWEE